jgi:hypothetical protein
MGTFCRSYVIPEVSILQILLSKVAFLSFQPQHHLQMVHPVLQTSL